MANTKKKYSLSPKELRSIAKSFNRMPKIKRNDSMFYAGTPYGMVFCDPTRDLIEGDPRAVKWLRDMLITFSQNKDMVL